MQDINTFFKVSEYEDKDFSLGKLVLSHKQDIDNFFQGFRVRGQGFLSREARPFPQAGH